MGTRMGGGGGIKQIFSVSQGGGRGGGHNQIIWELQGGGGTIR